ncbi:MAG: SpoVA/SpoVAEb family sporulation membrane protein [Limnochordia bacterium]|nr:SpoVA/SpoVAEb family sporulation membrane protein [Limnochordia bacterium]MDD2630589.1 SpoVA/SpoVAEb family sporulation membrane protein [Limnochordia bacterium]
MDKAQLDQMRQYQKKVQDKGPKPPMLINFLKAYLIGGLICLVGQGVFDFFAKIEGTQGETVATTLAGMILLGAVATALGFYDDLGEFGGMGAAVPITGFSNSVVSAAMEYRREGFILGLGGKIFSVAGPVLVFGILAGFVVGLVKALAGGYLF